MADTSNKEVELVMLAETREDVSKADQKASMILASLGIGVGAVLAGVLAGDWKPMDLHGLGEVGWWIGAALLGGAISCAGAAVWPRYDAGDASAGIYYWAHVASFSSLSSLTSALDSNTPTLDDRTRNQLWSMSKIANLKYGLIRKSMGLTAASIVFIFASLFVSAALKP